MAYDQVDVVALDVETGVGLAQAAADVHRGPPDRCRHELALMALDDADIDSVEEVGELVVAEDSVVEIGDGSRDAIVTSEALEQS